MEHYKKIELFSKRVKGKGSMNSWEVIIRAQPMPIGPLHSAVVPEELTPFFDVCPVVGWSGFDGGDRICYNANPSPNFGKLFFSAALRGSIGYRCPIVADSVTEWLTLTYQAGWDSHYYFMADDFVDRGPIIPDEPEYQHVTSLFDP